MEVRSSLLKRPILGSEDQLSDSGAATKILFLSTAVALSGPLATGCCIGYTSPTQSEITEDLDLSVSAYSAFCSMLTIGGMIGGSINGRLTDHIGRKAAMWVSEVLGVAGWLAIAFGKNVVCLDIGRILLGISNGVMCYAVPIYIAEITPKELRGRFTSAIQFTLCCGVALMFFVGDVVTWRELALIGAIPSLLHIFGLFYVPESPRWLAKVGKRKETLASLQRLRGKNADISTEADEIIDNTEALQQEPEKVFDLFRRRYSRALIVGIGLMVLQQFSGSAAVIAYAESIFTTIGFSTTVGTITTAISAIPAVVIGVLLTDKLGRRPLLMISAAGMCFSSALIGFSFLLMDWNYLNDFTPTVVFISIQVYSMSCVIGVAGLPWVIMSEIFPVNVKGSAGSLMTLVNGSCSWIIIYTFNFIMQWSSSGTFFIYSAVAGFAVIFVAKLVPETKGRTLEEIQVSISPSRG